MSEMVARAPEYPGYGSPCNGCGFCCAAEPCAIIRDFTGFNGTGPCPAMQFDDGRFNCGMVAMPSRYMGTPEFADPIIGAMFAKALGIGQSCDSVIDAALKEEGRG